MKKLRKAERRKVMTFTPVYDLQTKILLGYLGDLTLQGAMMVGEKPVETNQDLTLAIEIREASEIPGARLIIPAHVAWCRQEERMTYYNTGLQFLDLSEENKRVIESVLEKYRFSREIPF